jgi:hypothetical protein
MEVLSKERSRLIRLKIALRFLLLLSEKFESRQTHNRPAFCLAFLSEKRNRLIPLIRSQFLSSSFRALQIAENLLIRKNRSAFVWFFSQRSATASFASIAAYVFLLL